jgi:hypothetical protein
MTYEKLEYYRAELGAISQARIDFADRIHLSETSDEFREIIGSLTIRNLKNSVCDWHGSSIANLITQAKKDQELTNGEFGSILREVCRYKLESAGQVFLTEEQVKKSIEERSQANFFIRSPNNNKLLW